MLDDSTLLDAHIRLSETLRDTHYGHNVTIYNEPPPPLLFSRAVGNNIPFAVRGAARQWPAVDPNNPQRWNNERLLAKLGADNVTVSLTTNGFADSVVWVPKDGRRIEAGYVLLPENGRQDAHTYDIHANGTGLEDGDDGEFMFATPYDVQMPFHKVLSYMKSFSLSDSRARTIAFCQLQNDCLRGPEYSSLRVDVPEVIPSWASSVLGTEPEAVNFWMGRHESVTSLHSYPYENIYTVIRGTKTFTLYPPCDLFFFHKQEYKTAQWLPVKDSVAETSNMPRVALVPTPQEDGEAPSLIPWIPITHPSSPAPSHSRFAAAPKPFVVRIGPGDSLYLPKGWLHQVEQEEDDEGLCVAVNAWYEGWDGMGLAWGWTEYAKKMDEVAKICQSERSKV